MKCKRVNEWMALYVAGDLDPHTSQQVEAHLASCEACRALSSEYQASQEWAQTYEAPQFGEAFLAELRDNVLDEIARRPPRPSFTAMVFGSWLWKPALAAALLLLLGGLSLYFLGSNDDLPNHQERARDEQTTPNPQPPMPVPQDDGSKVADATPPLSPSERPKPSTSRRSAGEGRMAKRQKPDAPTLQPSVSPTPSPVVSQAIEPRSATPEVEGATRSDERTQIVIQTADPNIRIIWFAPKIKEASANNPIT